MPREIFREYVRFERWSIAERRIVFEIRMSEGWQRRQGLVNPGPGSLGFGPVDRTLFFDGLIGRRPLRPA